jgi:hypothetical protein
MNLEIHASDAQEPVSFFLLPMSPLQDCLSLNTYIERVCVRERESERERERESEGGREGGREGERERDR